VSSRYIYRVTARAYRPGSITVPRTPDYERQPAIPETGRCGIVLGQPAESTRSTSLQAGVPLQ
jgi:hypothetical protein